jgi:hypothetical protein
MSTRSKRRFIGIAWNAISVMLVAVLVQAVIRAGGIPRRFDTFTELALGIILSAAGAILLLFTGDFRGYLSEQVGRVVPRVSFAPFPVRLAGIAFVLVGVFVMLNALL